MQRTSCNVPEELVPLTEACAAVYQVLHAAQVRGLRGSALAEARYEIAVSLASLAPVYRREGGEVRRIDGVLPRAQLPDCVIRRIDLAAALERLLGEQAP